MHNPLRDAAPKDMKLRDPPVERVLAVISFDPILRVSESSGEGISLFQDRVRGTYPQIEMELEENVQLQVNTEGKLDEPKLTKNLVWRLFDPSREWRISLTTQSIALETQRLFETRDDLVGRLLFLTDALSETLRPTSLTRMGFRYLNVFGPKKMERLNEFVQPELFSFHRPPFDGDLKSFASQALFDVPEGRLLIKHGVLAPGTMHDFMVRPTAETRWYLDIDAFSTLSGPFESETVAAKAKDLTGRICSFFSWAITPEFMNEYRA